METFEKIGKVKAKAGDKAGAVGAFVRHLDIARKLAARGPDSGQARRDLVMALVYLGKLASDPIPHYRVALEIAERLERRRQLAPYGQIRSNRSARAWRFRDRSKGREDARIDGRSERDLTSAIFVTLAIFCDVVFAGIARPCGLVVAAISCLVLATRHSILAHLFGWPRLKRGISGDLFGLFA